MSAVFSGFFYYRSFRIYFSFACILLQLIFEGTRGDNAQGDIALDDVKLVEGPC